jgi:hypothetical protein
LLLLLLLLFYLCFDVSFYVFFCVYFSVVMVMVCVWYLPKSKEQCHEWRELGDKLGTSERRAWITLGMVSVTIVVRSHCYCAA